MNSIPRDWWLIVLCCVARTKNRPYKEWAQVEIRSVLSLVQVLSLSGWCVNTERLSTGSQRILMMSNCVWIKGFILSILQLCHVAFHGVFLLNWVFKCVCLLNINVLQFSSWACWHVLQSTTVPEYSLTEQLGGTWVMISKPKGTAL